MNCKRNKFLPVAMVALSTVAISLSACGDDSGTTSEKKDNVNQVESIDDLVHCTKSHYGEVVFVEDESTYYECTSDDWKALDDEEAINRLSSSVSGSAKSSSSVAVSDKDTAEVETQKVDSVTVKGVAEKGPFAKGSVVTITGLDSTFALTKNVFKGSVIDDKGNYEVSNVTFESQYAIVEVSGFFLNELTGKKTSGTRNKLSALVDLSGKGEVTANLNVFTELEKTRALYLVQNEKFNVAAAKNRATKELLEAFGVKEKADLVADELSFADTNSVGEALLTASVAILGNMSPSKLQSRLNDFAEQFEKTGVLFNNTLKAEIADFLSYTDSIDGLSSVRDVLKSSYGNASSVVANLYDFWVAAYQLPACNDENEETVEKNQNKASKFYGAGYACTSKRWHKSTALDTELGLCVSKTEGEFKATDDKKFYTCRNGSWTEITESAYSLKSCSEKRENEFANPIDGEYYVCSDLQWLPTDSLGFELKSRCSDETYDSVKTLNKKNYLCEQNEWRLASEAEAVGGICNDAKSDKIVETKDAAYVCNGKKWISCDDSSDGEFFATTGDHAKSLACINQEWVSCYEENNGKIVVDQKLSCEESGWRKASEGELATELQCTSANDSTFMNGYACVKNGWRKETDGELANENLFCTKTLLNSVSNKYACVLDAGAYVWRSATDSEEKTGLVCVASIDSTITNGYACVQGAWRAADEGEIATGKICTSTLDSTFSNGYACVQGGWRAETAGEKANSHTFCTSRNDGTIANGYTCKYKSWTESSAGEKATGKVCTSAIDSTFSNGYACVRNSWRGETAGEKANNHTFCTARNEDKYSNGYTCVNNGSYQWRTPYAYEANVGFVCNSSVNYRVFKDIKTSDYYQCLRKSLFDFNWQPLTYGTLTDSRDKQTYRTIEVNYKTWMVDNLNYAYGDNGQTTKYSVCGGGASGCDIYGRLYTWAAAVDTLASPHCGYGKTCSISTSKYQGVCPNGYHLPSEEEWTSLFQFVAGKSDYASADSLPRMLMARGSYFSGTGLNSYGFEALPAGMKRGSNYSWVGIHAQFWTSTEKSETSATMARIGVDDKSDLTGSVVVAGAQKDIYRSVRCVKD